MQKNKCNTFFFQNWDLLSTPVKLTVLKDRQRIHFKKSSQDLTLLDAHALSMKI